MNLSLVLKNKPLKSAKNLSFAKKTTKYSFKNTLFLSCSTLIFALPNLSAFAASTGEISSTDENILPLISEFPNHTADNLGIYQGPCKILQTSKKGAWEAEQNLQWQNGLLLSVSHETKYDDDPETELKNIRTVTTFQYLEDKKTIKAKVVYGEKYGRKRTYQDSRYYGKCTITFAEMAENGCAGAFSGSYVPGHFTPTACYGDVCSSDQLGEFLVGSENNTLANCKVTTDCRSDAYEQRITEEVFENAKLIEISRMRPADTYPGERPHLALEKKDHFRYNSDGNLDITYNNHLWSVASYYLVDLSGSPTLNALFSKQRIAIHRLNWPEDKHVIGLEYNFYDKFGNLATKVYYGKESDTPYSLYQFITLEYSTCVGNTLSRQ